MSLLKCSKLARSPPPSEPNGWPRPMGCTTAGFSGHRIKIIFSACDVRDAEWIAQPWSSAC